MVPGSEICLSRGALVQSPLLFFKNRKAQVHGFLGSRNLTLARRSGYFLAAVTRPPGSFVYLVVVVVTRRRKRQHTRNTANVNNPDRRIAGFFGGGGMHAEETFPPDCGDLAGIGHAAIVWYNCIM